MPDIPNRDELEQILARLLGKLNRRQLANLLEALGDPPNMANVPMSFWDEAGKELAQVVIPFSERVYLEAAERMAEIIPIGVDWGLVNEAASDWARHYGYDLVGGINDTTRRAVSSAISNFFEQQWTLRDLTSRLGRIYGPVRGEMIAITEVTRAAVEGERALVSEIEKEGIRMVEVWQTRNDEIVCPICGSRHRKKRGDGWSRNDGPPAHPRCRCWINHEFEKVKEERLTVPGEIIIDEHWGQVNNPNGPTMVYHGTGPDYAESIREKGLLRGKEWIDRPPSVYFTSDEKSAHDYAKLFGALGDEYSIVQFEIPKSFDPSVIFDEGDFHLMGTTKSFRIEKDIPVEWIKSIKVINTNPLIDTTTELLKSVIKRNKTPKFGYVPIILVKDTND